MTLQAEPNPTHFFDHWFKQAKDKELHDATEMTLSTVDRQGHPDSRIVLLKSFDEKGFTFYTNLNSRKGKQIQAFPVASLCFRWPVSQRQVRVKGQVEEVSPEEADAYFASRPRLSQLGAWASQQSDVLKDKTGLMAEVERLEKGYENAIIPRPPHWSGLRVLPEEIEFWQAGEGRLHDRFLYTRRGGLWFQSRLYP